jgi:anti-sigma regulatory factor (Ser/Thr protein kinase)
MDESSRVGEARRLAAALSARHGVDEVVAGRIALVVNELGSNLIKHAKGGRLLVAARAFDDNVALELTTIDDGPGMRDVAGCLADGYSTAGSRGEGLGAVQRLADDFDIYSSPGSGTLILARFYRQRDSAGGPRRPAGISFGVVCVAAPGEQVSGDGWAVSAHGKQAEVVVADGLGHGQFAAEASAAALDAFGVAGAQDVPRLIERTHAALRGTRGAALAVARLDQGAGRIHFNGAGNVMARVLSGVESKMLMAQSGTLGIQMRATRGQDVDWPAHSIVVLFSDGVKSRWELDPAMLQRDPSLIAAYIIWKYFRGHDDATVLVLCRAEG